MQTIPQSGNRKTMKTHRCSNRLDTWQHRESRYLEPQTLAILICVLFRDARLSVLQLPASIVSDE